MKGSITEECADGRFILTMDVPFERMWFSLLMGFGNQVKVLGPEKLKNAAQTKSGRNIIRLLTY